MFQVTTLDLNDVPKTEDGKVDYSKDFFKRPVNLTVSGQLEAEAMAMALGKGLHLLAPPSAQRRAMIPAMPQSSG